jgi:hypothetical protein
MKRFVEWWRRIDWHAFGNRADTVAAGVVFLLVCAAGMFLAANIHDHIHP